MAEAVVAVSNVLAEPANRTIKVYGTITIGASPLTYATGGIACDLLALIEAAVENIGSTVQPIFVRVEGIAGYKYEFDRANKKLIIRQVAAQTPAGTIASTLTITKGAILSGSELGLSADSAAATVNNNTIASTRVLTNPITSVLTGTAQAAAAMAQLAASAIPSGVSGDTITFEAVFQKFQ